MSGQHTPTPWHASRKSVYVSDIHHNCLAQMLRGADENAANAALIVKAVNNYATLKAALEEIASNYTTLRGDMVSIDGSIAQGIARTALAACSKWEAS